MALSEDLLISITALLDWFRDGTAVGEAIARIDEFVPQFYDLAAPGTSGGMAEIAAPLDSSGSRPPSPGTRRTTGWGNRSRRPRGRSNGPSETPRKSGGAPIRSCGLVDEAGRTSLGRRAAELAIRCLREIRTFRFGRAEEIRQADIELSAWLAG